MFHFHSPKNIRKSKGKIGKKQSTFLLLVIINRNIQRKYFENIQCEKLTNLLNEFFEVTKIKIIQQFC